MALKRRIVPTDYADLATAIGAANNGDEILALESGSPYTGANNRGLTAGGLDPLKIRSQRGEHRTVIDCENADRGFLANFSNVVIDGFTIVNGDSGAGGGGGIAISSIGTQVITIRNCIIHDCVAADGGGMVVASSVVPAIIENVLIYSCEADTADGGGVEISANSLAYFQNCTIAGNTVSTAARNGGGIDLLGSADIDMDNCIIWGNTADNGNEIYITALATLDLNYSCYSNGANDVVNNGNFNTTATVTTDPLFVAGNNGNYYLSQLAAGQGADTPCLNTGTGTVGTPGDYVDDFWRRTTRSDDWADTDTLDMGYHYRGVYRSGIPEVAPPELRWKPMHKILDIPSLAANAVSQPSGRIDMRKKNSIAISVRLSFHADSTGNVIVHVISSNNDDDGGGQYDTEDFNTMTITNDAGESIQKTLPISGTPRFYKIYIENEDDAQAVTDIEVFATPLGTEQLHDEEMVNYAWV